MKTLRLFTLILSVFAICQAGLGADAKADPNINQAKVALRAQQYAEAVVALDKALGAKIKQADEALSVGCFQHARAVLRIAPANRQLCHILSGDDDD